MQTLRQVEKLLVSLPDSTKKYFQIIDKSQLKNIGADPGCALALTGLSGTSFGNASTGPLTDILPKMIGTHGFFPDHKEIQTGFVVYGAGIAKGVKIKEMNMTDICPVIIKLTGLPFHTMDGKLYPQMFELK